MAKFLFIITLLIASHSIATAQSNSKKDFEIDTSGIETFWRIYSILKSDCSPSEEEWNTLFSTPGYALLEIKEHRRKTLTEALKLAYMPSRVSERDAILKSGKGYIAFLIPHLIEIPNHRQDFAKLLQKNHLQRLFVNARRAAQKFLPDKTTEQISPPPISFVFFQSRGYERILMDPMDLMQRPNQVNVVAHELHHYYRNKRERGVRDLGDDMLAWALVNIEVEGTAGLLDKREVPKLSVSELEKRYTDKNSLDYYKQYKIEYARSNEWLKFTEKYLEQIAEAMPEEKSVLGTKLHDELPDNGRAMGSYMSEIIIKQLGQKRFLQTVGEPFAFWQVYNEAAKSTKGSAYTLSEKAMRVINTTREIYQTDSKTKN